MMRVHATRWIVAGIVTAAGLAAAPMRARAEDKADAPKDGDLVVTTAGNIRYISLKDWPARRKNGVISPVPMEEYLSMKFGQLREQLAAVNQRFQALEQKMKQFEESQTQLQAQVTQVKEDAAPTKEVSHGDEAKSPEAAKGPPAQPKEAEQPAR